jgi:hypothetical protein
MALIESIRTMPAAAAAAKSSGKKIKFSEYPVYTFTIIMNAFY